MNNYKELKLKNINEYIFTTTIIIVCMLFIYYTKGLYPFGNNSVVYADMVQQTAPFYYNFFDIMKGDSSIFYDFNTAMGFNTFSTMSGYFLSPFSYIILLFKRENILQAINIVLMGKLICCGLSCNWILKKYFKNIKVYWIVFLSLLYAFSSYNLIMYQIINWLDIVIIFPILIVALKNLLDNKKLIPYIVTLALITLISYQVAFMVILFILFMSAIYMNLYIEKQERKNSVLLLGIGTIVAILIASIKILPAFIQTFDSSRVGGNTVGILKSHTSYMYDRISFLFSGVIICPLILLLISKYKENKKFLILTISALILTLIPVVVDPVNRIWHMGSYSSFPFRYGFIPTLIFIIMAGYYINKYESEPIKKCVIKKMKITIAIILSILFMMSLILIGKNFHSEIQQAVSSLTLYVNLKVFKVLLLAAGITFGVATIIFTMVKGSYNNMFVKLIFMLIITSSILFNLYSYVGIDRMINTIADKYEGMNAMYDYNNNEDDYYRIKDKEQIYTTYTANTPLVTNKKSLAHYTSVTSGNHMAVMKKLGYGSNWTRTYDGGGTIFTDSLFSTRYIIYNRELNGSSYNYIDEVNGMKIYENRFYMPNGIKILKNESLNSILEASSVFEAQNNIYKSISNSDENIIEELTDFNLINLSKSQNEEYSVYEKNDGSKSSYIEFEINSIGKKQIYLNVLRDVDNSKNSPVYDSLKVYVNGDEYNTYFDGVKSNEFPTAINNGLLDLGEYNNETIKVTLEVLKNFDVKELSVGLLDIDKLEDLANLYTDSTSNIVVNKNNINVTVQGNLGENLFITIPFDEGWKCSINREITVIEKTFDNFISIPLIEGENEIELTFKPKGLILGMIISLSIVILIVISTILNKKGVKPKLDIYEKISYYLYKVIYVIATLVVYIIPIIFFLYYWMFT